MANLPVEKNVKVMKANLRRFPRFPIGSFPIGQLPHGIVCALLMVLCIGIALPLILDVQAADENLPPTIKPEVAVDVDTLVAQLGNDSYLVREKASSELWRLGKGALPALKKAMSGNNPEAADRARELFLYIAAGVLFDSAEEIKALVLKFSRSNADSKLVILRKLMELGQWKQVLHLAKLEEQASVRAQMADIVKQTAGRATRDAIAKGNFDLAGEILELTAEDPKSMLLRAWFHFRRGQLDQELQKAADLPGKEGAAWRMSLHRASGNIPAAIREAEKAGEQKLADAMRVLDGDAIPWLRRSSQEDNLDIIYRMGCKIQIDRLEGNQKHAAVEARELARLAHDEDTTARAVNCLAANGFRIEAVDLLRRQDVESAFDYFDSTESPQLCLEVLGIPKEAKPPFTAWVKKFTAEAFKDENKDRYHQLILLASFLMSHGEREHTLAVLTPMMKALESDGSDEWFELITSMAIYGLGEEAIHFMEQRGNEDGETDLGVKKLLTQMPSKSLSHVWDHLKERNNQNIAKALHELALLSGLIADPENETDKLHKALTDEVAAADADVKQARMAALFSFSVKRNDLATASRMADLLAADNAQWVRSKIFLDTALLRWKSIEPQQAAEAKGNPGNYFNLIKWHITLRKLGKEQQAKDIFDRALMLSLGSAEILNRMGWELHEAGYDDKAVDLWLRAAALADPTDSDFDRSIIYLSHYGQALYNRDQWKLASAITEVSTQLMMRGRTNSSVSSILRLRFYAEFCQGMVLLKMGKKSTALGKLDEARQLIPGDGSLADEFFPILRNEDIGKHYNEWFDDSYRHVAAACKLYPKAHNSQNTAAWLASRAVRKLDAALAHSEAALKIRPTQGAYLDTMAEVWFAKGNRAKAVAWSEKAVAASISSAQGSPRSESQVITNYKELHKQLERFKTDPLPK